MAASTQTILITFFVFLLSVPGSYAATKFSISNNCRYSVWPAIVPVAGSGLLPTTTTGFALQPGESNTFPMPDAWSGRLWGRTLCSHNITGMFSCVTGDCGSSTVECDSGNASVPVTLAEFTLNGTDDGLDYFDVSLAEGFNLPMRVEPWGGTGAGNCRATGCESDLNEECPIELKVTKDGEAVACKSSCEAHQPCNSILFKQFSKSKCPYACDHASFTCASADYTITFCPTSSSKSSNKRGKKKKHPAAVDNSEGHVNGSRSPHYILVKVVVPLMSVSSILSFVYCFYSPHCACKTSYRSPNREIETSMSLGLPRAQTIAPNPQPFDVDMGNYPVDG